MSIYYFWPFKNLFQNSDADADADADADNEDDDDGIILYKMCCSKAD